MNTMAYTSVIVMSVDGRNFCSLLPIGPTWLWKGMPVQSDNIGCVQRDSILVSWFSMVGLERSVASRRSACPT